MNSALPMTASISTNPQNRESYDRSRLSPIMKSFPAGTRTGGMLSRPRMNPSILFPSANRVYSSASGAPLT